MSRLIQFQKHPFRLLLYLEWILLGITILPEFPLAGVLPPPPHHPLPPAAFGPWSSLLTILSIATFGAIGLRLPKGKLLSRIVYTGFSLGLIVLAVVAGSGGFYFFPSLLLVLVIRSCLIFGLAGRLIVTGIGFILFLVISLIPVRDIHLVRGHRSAERFPIPLLDAEPKHMLPPPPNPTDPPKNFITRQPLSADQVKMLVLNLILKSALSFGLVLVFVLLLVNALLAERQSRQKLAIANERLRQYALRIEDQATLQERNRIAREIHDSLGHSLTAQSIQLENALLFLQSNVDKAQTFLQDAKRLGKDALQEVRQSIATLRSNPMQGQSLEDAIASLVKDFHRITGIEPEYKINLLSIVPDSTIRRSLPLSAEISTAIYRITKEALTNIYKHSEATQVKIRLISDTEAIYLLIEDNGKGFHPDYTTTGFGLQGMQERTVALGGQFNITSQPEAGCRVTAYIPLPTLYPYP